MPFSDNNVFARDDTFFGVCEAIGEDLGFNANYLRVAFALPLLYAPLATIAVYLALAVIIGLTRLIVPNPRRAAPEEVVESAKVEVEATSEPLPIAA